MTNPPQCIGCDRHASDWIEVDGVYWEPDLQHWGGEWKCWACRMEPHSDMREGYVPQSFWQKVEQYHEG